MKITDLLQSEQDFLQDIINQMPDLAKDAFINIVDKLGSSAPQKVYIIVDEENEVYKTSDKSQADIYEEQDCIVALLKDIPDAPHIDAEEEED